MEWGDKKKMAVLLAVLIAVATPIFLVTSPGLRTIRRCAEGHRESPWSVKWEYNIAGFYLNTMRPERALECYNEIVNDPTWQKSDYVIAAYFGIARAYDEMGKKHMAMQCYAAFIASYPNDPLAVDAERLMGSLQRL